MSNITGETQVEDDVSSNKILPGEKWDWVCFAKFRAYLLAVLKGAFWIPSALPFKWKSDIALSKQKCMVTIIFPRSLFGSCFGLLVGFFFPSFSHNSKLSEFQIEMKLILNKSSVRGLCLATHTLSSRLNASYTEEKKIKNPVLWIQCCFQNASCFLSSKQMQFTKWLFGQILTLLSSLQFSSNSVCI